MSLNRPPLADPVQGEREKRTALRKDAAPALGGKTVATRRKRLGPPAAGRHHAKISGHTKGNAPEAIFRLISGRIAAPLSHAAGKRSRVLIFGRRTASAKSDLSIGAGAVRGGGLLGPVSHVSHVTRMVRDSAPAVGLNERHTGCGQASAPLRPSPRAAGPRKAPVAPPLPRGGAIRITSAWKTAVRTASERVDGGRTDSDASPPEPGRHETTEDHEFAPPRNGADTPPLRRRSAQATKTGSKIGTNTNSSSSIE